VFVLAKEHGAALPLVPRCPTLPHLGPLCPGEFCYTSAPVSWRSYGPLLVRTVAPQRAPIATASSTGNAHARPYVTPAAKQSPHPYAPPTGPGPGAARTGPPGRTQPPSPPAVVTTIRGGGSSSPGSKRSPASSPLPTRTSISTPAARRVGSSRDVATSVFACRAARNAAMSPPVK